MIIKDQEEAAQGFVMNQSNDSLVKNAFLMVDLTKRGAVYIGYLSELQK